MRNRKTLYIALFLILAGFGLKAHATLPDSRQYLVHLQQNTGLDEAAKTTGNGSVLIMVSPSGEYVHFKATLTNTGASCDLTLVSTTDNGKTRTIARLNPTTFKVERAEETGNRIHLSGSVSRNDLADQFQSDSLKEFCKLLRDGTIHLRAHFSVASQQGFAG